MTHNNTTNESKTMKITTAQLNQVATLIGTDDKNLVISVVIKSLVNEGGMTVKAAFESVFGEDSYETLKNEVYNMLKN